MRARDLPPLLQALVADSADAFVLVDGERRLLFGNAAYAQLVGIRSAELERRIQAGTYCYEQLPLGICEESCAVKAATAIQAPVRMDEVPSCRDRGEIHQFVVQAIPIEGVGILETYRDVSAEARVHKRYQRLLQEAADANVRLEARVAERTAELTRANEELRRTQAQLVHAEKMMALGQLVAGIAHELNNPLNFISCSVQPLREQIAALCELIDFHEANLPDDAIIRARVAAEHERIDYEFARCNLSTLIDTVADGAGRSSAIVRDLRVFSRMDTSLMEPIDLEPGIHATLRLVAPMCDDRVRVEAEIGPLPQVRGAAGQLNQVLLNLVTNAVHATPGTGVIRVVAKAPGDGTVRLSIIDQGSGVPPELRGRIFDPFFTTKPPGQGTGLGLSISDAIVREHGGTIELVDTPGGGATFHVTLPALHGRPER